MMKRIRGAMAPYLLIFPGGLWIVIFFVVPIVAMFSLSMQTGNLIEGFHQTFNIANYGHVLVQYHEQFIRSLVCLQTHQNNLPGNFQKINHLYHSRNHYLQILFLFRHYYSG